MIRIRDTRYTSTAALLSDAIRIAEYYGFVPLEDLPRLVEPSIRARMIAAFRELGFKYVTLDLEGFRSGSLNALIPLESLQRPGASLKS